MNNYQKFLNANVKTIHDKVIEFGLNEEIPHNDFNYTTEIREEVVKFIISWMLRGNSIDIDREFRTLYYVKDYGRLTSRKYDNGIRVHGIEVQCAFYALQEKGYFIRKFETSTYTCYQLKKSSSHECQDLEYMAFDYNIDWEQFD